MTIASKLNTVNTALSNIKQALEDKGCTITGDITTYSAVIDNIPSSGGDIITAKNATGAVISEGDKVWFERTSGGWNIKNLLYVESFSQNSTTIDANHVASNFGSTGLTCNQVFDFSKPWTFKTHIKTGQVSGNQFVYCGSGATENGMNSSGFIIWFASGPLRINFYTGSNSSFTGICSFDFIPSGTLTANTEYYIECGWTGEEYFVKYSTDGQTWLGYENRFSSTTPINQWGSSFVLGHLNWLSSMYFYGNIYLNDTSMTVDGSVVWKPYVKGVYDTTNLFTGIANEAIAIDGTGEVKTALPEPITVSVTADVDNAEISVE